MSAAQIIKTPAPGGWAKLPIGLILLWPDLPEHWRLLLPSLLSFDGNQNRHPDQKLLGKLTQRSRRTVNDTLGQMEAVGLIASKREHRGCLYTLANVDDEQVRTEIVNAIKRHDEKY